MNEISAASGRKRCGGGIRTLAIMIALGGLSVPSQSGLAQSTQHRASQDRVYVISKYPVEAVANNAVVAKRKAIAAGQQRAFRSLLKRLVPVTRYEQLKELRAVDARGLIASVSVRSEAEPTARYMATMDFSFMPDRVRDLLQQRRVPFVDQQAAETTLVTIYRVSDAARAALPAAFTDRAGAGLWLSLWTDLDLENALTPLVAKARSPRISAGTIDSLAEGDLSGLRILAGEYGASQVVAAIATPDPAKKRLEVILVGQDAVGPLYLKRSYRVFNNDFAYAMELAAVIDQGILEGRWKAAKAPAGGNGGAGPAGPPQPVQVWVIFNSLAQWQNIRRVFHDLPGASNVRIGGQTARNASIALRFPGGGPGLQSALAARGLNLEHENGNWIVR